MIVGPPRDLDKNLINMYLYRLLSNNFGQSKLTIMYDQYIRTFNKLNIIINSLEFVIDKL